MRAYCVYAKPLTATKEEKKCTQKANLKIENSSFKEECKKGFVNWKSVFRLKIFLKKNIKNDFEK